MEKEKPDQGHDPDEMRTLLYMICNAKLEKPKQ